MCWGTLGGEASKFKDGWRKDAQIQLMWFGQCSSGKGNKMVSWMEPFGQMQCNTVVTSTALCVTESMYYAPALICPISASGDPLS